MSFQFFSIVGLRSLPPREFNAKRVVSTSSFFIRRAGKPKNGERRKKRRRKVDGKRVALGKILKNSSPYWEKEGKKRNNESLNYKILNKIPSIFYFLLIIHSLPTHPPKFPFPSILAYRTRDFGFLRRFYERREINFPLSCTLQPRKPRLSFPFGRNLSTLHPLARFFLTSLPSLDPLQSPRRTVFCNRAFRVQCYLYHPRVHSACSVAIATNDKLSHENAPLSLHVLLARKGPPLSLSLSLDSSVSIPNASLSPSLNRYERRLITRAYTRIRLYVRWNIHDTTILLALLAPVRDRADLGWKRKADWKWETGSPTDIIRVYSSVVIFRPGLWFEALVQVPSRPIESRLNPAREGRIIIFFSFLPFSPLYFQIPILFSSLLSSGVQQSDCSIIRIMKRNYYYFHKIARSIWEEMETLVWNKLPRIDEPLLRILVQFPSTDFSLCD